MEKKLKIENFASLITTTAAGKVVGIQISAEQKGGKCQSLVSAL